MSLRTRLGLSTEPVFLMDGSAYVFRSFYANQNMSRADGMQTNVLFMVMRLLFKILREENPAYFAFILDGKGKNFRHRLYPDYKAHRLATPEPLSAQLPPLLDAVKALGLSVTISEDCEADDCIASLTDKLRREHPVVIIGADKDLKQCLAPDVFIWDPSGKDEKLTGLDAFTEQQGFPPSRWPDYQAIVGDSSDNIPGVPGIGPKGACTLMQEFTGLEDIQKRFSAVPPNLRKKLEGNLEQAFLSRQLTTLHKDCCSCLKLEDLSPRPPQRQELMQILGDFELRSLAREFSSMLRMADEAASGAHGQSALSGTPTSGLGAQLKPKQETSGLKLKHTLNMEAPADLPEQRKNTGSVSVASSAASTTLDVWKTAGQGSLWAGSEKALPDAATGPENMLDAASFITLASPTDVTQALSKSGDTVALFSARDAGSESGLDKQDVRLILADGAHEYLMGSGLVSTADLVQALTKGLSGKLLIAGNLKALCEDAPMLRQIPLEACFDLSLSAWLLSPEEYDYGLRRLFRRWGGEASALLERFTAGKDTDNRENAGTHAPGPVWKAVRSLVLKTGTPGALCLALAALLEEQLAANSLTALLREMEMPLIPVLLAMQDVGIGIDTAAFADFLKETETDLARITQDIYKAAGHEFNIRSAKQLGDVLFDELKLPRGRKTGGGQSSTSVEALEKLEGKHPVIAPILEYRKLEKLRSTYLEPLPKIADAQHRLHTCFNQSATATGRLSSSNPNLQNIPVRGPLGMRMRACFTAAPGKRLVSADYSQIELRVLAHLSQDPTLLDAFRKGEDIHSRTATLLFDLPADQITPDQRRNAKTINFGLVYGMGPQKLARELNISMNEAKEFITKYFARLGKLKAYFDNIEKDAQTYGYVSTMTGRRRLCPDIQSANQQLRSRARRQAINTCIQGSAADIIKLAMLAAADDAELRKLQARLVLQIHDELLLECPEANAEPAGKRLANIMASIKPGGEALSVPLSCDWGAGRSWAEAH